MTSRNVTSHPTALHPTQDPARDAGARMTGDQHRRRAWYGPIAQGLERFIWLNNPNPAPWVVLHE